MASRVGELPTVALLLFAAGTSLPAAVAATCLFHQMAAQVVVVQIIILRLQGVRLLRLGTIIRLPILCQFIRGATLHNQVVILQVAGRRRPLAIHFQVMGILLQVVIHHPVAVTLHQVAIIQCQFLHHPRRVHVVVMEAQMQQYTPVLSRLCIRPMLHQGAVVALMVHQSTCKVVHHVAHQIAHQVLLWAVSQMGPQAAYQEVH